ncbi:hypothetical protein FACS1894189_3860 [Planctomycetales bacterium]|nr:hypothetical protein FACS1894189_3860 [Planctomycetales bacterium]
MNHAKHFRVIGIVVFGIICLGVLIGTLAAGVLPKLPPKHSPQPPMQRLFDEILRSELEVYRTNPGELEQLHVGTNIDEVLVRTNSKRQTIRSAIRSGMNLSLRRADDLADYILIEHCYASQSIQTGKIDEAVDSVRYVLQVLGQQSPRLAAPIRLKTLDVLQEVLASPRCEKRHVQELYDILFNQLEHWSSDTAIWSQYQDEEKELYEEILRSSFENALSPEDFNKLLQAGAFKVFETQPMRKLALDQLAFLNTMESVIASCNMPYYERADSLTAIFSKTQPVIAELLLREIPQEMYRIALDRTQCESVCLAMSIVLHGQGKNAVKEKLTGNPFIVKLLPNGIMVSYRDSVKPFYVQNYP